MRKLVTILSLCLMASAAMADKFQTDNPPTSIGDITEYQNPTIGGIGLLAFTPTEHFGRDGKTILARANQFCMALGHTEAVVEGLAAITLNGRAGANSSEYLLFMKDGSPLKTFATWRSGNDLSLLSLAYHTFITPNAIYYSGKFSKLTCR